MVMKVFPYFSESLEYILYIYIQQENMNKDEGKTIYIFICLLYTFSDFISAYINDVSPAHPSKKIIKVKKKISKRFRKLRIQCTKMPWSSQKMTE